MIFQSTKGMHSLVWGMGCSTCSLCSAAGMADKERVLEARLTGVWTKDSKLKQNLKSGLKNEPSGCCTKYGSENPDSTKRLGYVCVLERLKKRRQSSHVESREKVACYVFLLNMRGTAWISSIFFHCSCVSCVGVPKKRDICNRTQKNEGQKKKTLSFRKAGLAAIYGQASPSSLAVTLCTPLPTPLKGVSTLQARHDRPARK